MKPSSFDKIIFLDVDGVLNNMPGLRADTWCEFDERCVEHFADIVRSTGAEIVLSSSWRHSDQLERKLLRVLREAGVPDFVDTTPDFGLEPRATEIRDWLNRNRVARFAILDDDDDVNLLGLGHSVFLTDPTYGLTEEIANRVIDHLNSPAASPADGDGNSDAAV